MALRHRGRNNELVKVAEDGSTGPGLVLWVGDDEPYVQLGRLQLTPLSDGGCLIQCAGRGAGDDCGPA